MNQIDITRTEGIPSGLSYEEVARLTEEGKVNISHEKVGKSYFEIVRDNLFTFFNLIWAIVALLLILCKSYVNMTFLSVVIPNVVISIVQEIKAKKIVEKLAVTTDPKATVIREGELATINAEDIVLGDVVLLETGKQVPSDAVVISGYAEANESMLTGESDAIKKEVGDKILAGSFLVSGSIYAKVINVGRDNYVHKIEKAAKSFKAPSSNLFRDLNKLIKTISAFLVPMALILFGVNLLANRGKENALAAAVIKTCGSVIGMIPAGIYLLVTLTLTLSVVLLAKKRTLVQDMYSIEMLASADIVCLDKTGTITDGTMRVTDVIPLSALPLSEIERIMSHIEGTESSINNTSQALIDRFGKDVSVKIIKKIPFSSARKYSAVEIDGLGAYSIGAPHFVPCPVSKELDAEISRKAREGERVLLLVSHDELESEGTAIALISIADRIRPGANETIQKFQEQGVTLKVISGDHAETVSCIASKAGILNADKYISCETLDDESLILAAEDYTVFGRVTPEQKVLLIKTLKINGHTVAMTGDGVNDTLALKESNCAIAMADGSEMARKVSQIVLMDSDFSTLPDVVREGRKCINNVRQSSALFLMKTLFTIFLSIITICIPVLGYPFEPRQLIMLELLIIGLPSTLLALEPNNERIKGNYLDTVIIKSAPNALAMLFPVIAIMALGQFVPGMSMDSRDAIATASITLIGFLNLAALCTPMTRWRKIVVAFSAILLIAIIPVSVIWLDDMFLLRHVMEQPVIFLCFMAASMVCTVIMQVFRGKIEKLVEFIHQKGKEAEEKLHANQKTLFSRKNK